MKPHTPHPAWKELYVAALLEPNGKILLDRVCAAEKSIRDRVEELQGRRKFSERQHLDHAIRALHHLQQRCLNIPRSEHN
jgi:hypothetical protein